MNDEETVALIAASTLQTTGWRRVMVGQSRSCQIEEQGSGEQFGTARADAITSGWKSSDRDANE